MLIAAGPDFASEDGLYNTPLAMCLPAVPTGESSKTPFRPQVTDDRQAPSRHPRPAGRGR